MTVTLALASWGAMPAASATQLPSSVAHQTTLEALPQNCAEAVALATKEEGLEGEAANFACGPSGASVHAAAPDTSQLIELQSRAATDSVAPMSAVNCLPLEPYTRRIVNEVQEEYEWCILYGHAAADGSITWWDTIFIEGVNWPGWSTTRMAYVVDGWNTNPGSVSWKTALYRNAAGFFLQELDFIEHSMVLNNGKHFDETLRNNSSQETGVFHVALEDIHIEVPIFDYSVTLEDWEDHDGFRYLCNRDDPEWGNNCTFPDGQEAPWF